MINKRKTTAPMVSGFEEHLKSELIEPEFVQAFMDEVIREPDEKHLRLALQYVVSAQGEKRVAQRSGLRVSSLRQILGQGGKLSFIDVAAIIRAVGLRFEIKPSAN